MNNVNKLYIYLLIVIIGLQLISCTETLPFDEVTETINETENIDNTTLSKSSESISISEMFSLFTDIVYTPLTQYSRSNHLPSNFVITEAAEIKLSTSRTSLFVSDSSHTNAYYFLNDSSGNLTDDYIYINKEDSIHYSMYFMNKSSIIATVSFQIDEYHIVTIDNITTYKSLWSDLVEFVEEEWVPCMTSDFQTLTDDVAGYIVIGLYPGQVLGVMTVNCIGKGNDWW